MRDCNTLSFRETWALAFNNKAPLSLRLAATRAMSKGIKQTYRVSLRPIKTQGKVTQNQYGD